MSSPQESAVKNGWALVETSPPPRYTYILIYVTYPKEIEVQPKIHLAYLDDDNQWRVQSLGRVQGAVTHWMPLPPPPA